MDVIRSAAHPLIKRVRAVARGRERGTLLLEGVRLVRDALCQKVPLDAVLVAASRLDDLAALLDVPGAPPPQPVADELLGRIGTQVSPDGVLALAHEPAPEDLTTLDPALQPRLVVAAGLQDPGNLGALARIAEATGASVLVVTRGGARPWSPKALRGSMGSLLRLRVCADADPEQLVRTLRERGYRGVLAATRDGAAFDRFDWTPPWALFLAAESGALGAAEEAALERVTIPMHGQAESLNVATAAAVLLFAGRPHDTETEA